MKHRMHPNSLNNLRPHWTKENHPKSPGPPKKEDCLLSCIKESLAKLSLNGKTTREQNIGEALVQKAETGDLKAIEILMSYLHAKPNQGHDVKAVTELLVKWDGNRNAPSITSTASTPTPG